MLTKYFIDSVATGAGRKNTESETRLFLNELFSVQSGKELPRRVASTRENLEKSLNSIATSQKIQVVDKIDANVISAKREDEWDYKEVVMSIPTYLHWPEPINQGNPDRFLAVIQHINFMQSICSAGVKIRLIKPREELPAGVFTRDVFAVIGGKVLRANMLSEVRKPEEGLIENAGYIPPQEARIEWGDLFLDKPNGLILLGISYRTNMEGAEWLQAVVGTDYEVKVIRTKGETLHFDCAFSLVGRLVYPWAIEKQADIEFLQKLYAPLAFLNMRQAKALVSNLISINSEGGCSQILATPKFLKIAVHYPPRISVIPIELTEAVKVDGGHRCSVAPLK